MIALPAKSTDAGAEARLLLAECRGPSYPAYTIADSKTCMQLMDVVLHNRMKTPKLFLANRPTLLAVITAPGQFQGFQHYPNYDAGIRRNLQRMVDIANNSKDSRSKTFAEFINAASQIAIGVPTLDPSPGNLTAWRTAGAGSPGARFVVFKTVQGTSFYYLPKTKT